MNLHQSNCLVTGWGRCAEALAAKLKGMDARVTVAGRCKDKLAHAFCHGYDTLLLEDLDLHIHTFDLYSTPYLPWSWTLRWPWASSRMPLSLI